ncbi:hypothetical protein [Marinobacter sp.]|uniref:hypothetical protein n=1 Tax=Marinobacter sp. TaxID=50741 RepID=UPI002633719C|nr:hypothetical protein [Marinobacter sp.]
MMQTPESQLECDKSEIEVAEKNLKVQMNYGGILHDPNDHKLVMDYRQGDLPDEIGQMRRLAMAFNKLADALEDKGIDCSERLPQEDDADENGFVEWLRSGVWLRGPVSEGKPVDASRWRSMGSRI